MVQLTNYTFISIVRDFEDAQRKLLELEAEFKADESLQASSSVHNDRSMTSFTNRRKIIFQDLKEKVDKRLNFEIKTVIA